MKNSFPSIALLLLSVSSVGAQELAPSVRAPWTSYPSATYPNGLSPSDGQLVDLNGDGFLDLAIASNSAGPQLSVLLGDGLGGFGTVRRTGLATGSSSVAAADLDADGDQDLVLANSGQGGGVSAITVLINRGDANFDPAISYPVGGPTRSVVVADVDGNGTLDIVAALLQTVGVVFGNGDGTFGPPSAFVLPSGVTDVVAGDLEGDGDTDLVVAHSSGDVSVMLNIGIGFALPVTYASIPSGFFHSEANVELADIDLDGDLDVFLSSTSTGTGTGGVGYGAAAFFRTATDGSLGLPTAVPLDPDAGGAVDLAVTDVTGDGWPDLVGATSGSSWALAPGDGVGGFLPASAHRTGGGPVAVALGDLNGDGTPDVVTVAASSLDACVHLNGGAGSFADAPSVDMVDPAVAPASASQLVVGDIDLDGDLDAIVGYSENWNGVFGIAVRRNRGDGVFSAPELYSTPQFPEWLTTGDVDGDGFLDLVWLDGWGAFNAKVRMKKNLGDGSFGATQVLPGNYCEQDAKVRLLDLNGDGRPEILVYTCYDSLYVLRNTKDAGFTGPFVTRVSGGSGALAGGDFDGDGRADVVTNSGLQGYVEVSLGLGNGTFTAPVEWTTGRGVEAIEVGDVDEDGKLDIVAAYSLDGDGISVLLGRGDGTFAPTVDFPGVHSGATDNLHLGDLDGDGHLDAFVAARGAQELTLWRGTGDGTMLAMPRVGTGLPPTSVATGDFQGDGTTDLLVLVESTGAGGWFYPAITLLQGLVDPWTDLGQGLAGSGGVPVLHGAGSPNSGANFRVDLRNALPGSSVFLVGGLTQVNQAIRGGILVPAPNVVLARTVNADGNQASWFQWPPSTPSGFEIFFQAWVRDPSGPEGFAVSNALRVRQP